MSRHRFAGAIPAIAIPSWPEPRYVDRIDAALRAMEGERRDALLGAVARAIDEYLATTLDACQSQPTLDAAFDEVLHHAALALAQARSAFSPGHLSRRAA